MINPHDRHFIGKARLLRRQGKTYNEIRGVLGPISDDKLIVWLRGIPRPAETYRAARLTEVRRECRRLRGLGFTHGEIAEITGASVGSLSLWLRDIPLSAVAPPERRIERFQATCAELRERRLAAREAQIEVTAARVDPPTDRELFCVGLALYWAEGAKSKPWRVNDRVTFINGDPTVVSVFMRWLELLGVEPGRFGFRVSIHESADVARAERFWAAVVGVPVTSLKCATLKRHKPATNRKNTGEGYYGCLIVDVRKSADLYRSIEGWWRGLARSVERVETD
jgi:hypothetical protein